jgi:hypothetical protein
MDPFHVDPKLRLHLARQHAAEVRADARSSQGGIFVRTPIAPEPCSDGVTRSFLRLTHDVGGPGHWAKLAPREPCS